MIGTARPASLRSLVLRLAPFLFLLLAAVESVPLARIAPFTSSEWLYAALLLAHAAAGVCFFARGKRERPAPPSGEGDGDRLLNLPDREQVVGEREDAGGKS